MVQRRRGGLVAGRAAGVTEGRGAGALGRGREPTYRTPDIAYHIEKLKRGFDLIIDVFGADHIAEDQQVIAAVKALGYDILLRFARLSISS